MTLATKNPIRTVVIFLAVLLGPLLATARAAVTVPSGSYPTIQSAIDAAINGSLPDGTTINVQPGTYFEALQVGNSSARSFTIRGVGGADATVIDAAGKGTTALFVDRMSGTIVFQGLTFRHGSAPGASGGGFVVASSSPSFIDSVFELNSAFNGGGGVLIASNASFTHCTFRNNSAQHFGGGVFIVSGSRPVFTNCDITGNVAGTSTFDGAGGGVNTIDGSPTFHGSRINSNSSKFAAGGIFHMGAFGSPYGQSVLVMDDSDVADNVSTRFSPSDNPSEGGGIHIEDNAKATLTRVRILRNHAGTGGGLNAYRARYDVVDSIIDSNEANATNGIGGGIAATSNNPPPGAVMPGSVVNLTGTLVRNNFAIASDGSLTGVAGGIAVVGDNYSSTKASLTLTNSVVDSNRASSQGGGILINRATLGATNSMVIRNQVSGGSVPFGGGVLITTTSSATFASTTIALNSAGSHGGGLFVNDASAISLSGSRVYANTSGGRGGGLFIGSSDQSGSVQNSIVADNTSAQFNAQINEDACSSVTYQSNTITPPSGSAQFSGCGTISSRASGTNSNVPRYVHFLAVPASGASATLVWSVARATSVTIAGVGTWNMPATPSTYSADVAPGSSASYTLSATATSPNGGNYGPVTVGVVIVLPPTTPSGFVPGDFDGDGKSDTSVFRPSNGTWYIRNSLNGLNQGLVWGGSGDVPVQGDYDSDGLADMAVFRPSNGTWYIRQSSTAAMVTSLWGGVGDVPVPGDYDGDGHTDVAVFRASSGVWYIRNSNTGLDEGLVWGGSGDVATPGDFDGDGKTDMAVFRPSNGTWYLRRSSNGALVTSLWGGVGDVPVAGDYDGDGHADVAVFRASSGVWYIRNSNTGLDEGLLWGGSGDVPTPGDFDGDGKTDMAVFRPSNGTWYLRNSHDGSLTTVVWGAASDIPILKH